MIKYITRNPTYNTGLVFVLLSLTFYIGAGMGPREDALAFFLPNYALAAVYLIGLIIKRKKIADQDRIHNTILFLIMFLISSWSLNRALPIFDKPTQWFSIAMVISSFNLVAFAYHDRLPSWAMHLISFLSAFSTSLFLYMAIYLLPYSGLGLIGFLLLGISLHVFSPLLLFIYSIPLLRKSIKEKRYWKSFVAGTVATLCVVTGYIGMWSNTSARIDNAWHKGHEPGTELPGWVHVGTDVPVDFWTKRILRAGLTYQVADFRDQSSFGLFMFDITRDERVHDPLVTIAALLGGRPKLTEQDQKQLLQSMLNMGRESEDRLWSGSDLLTEHVNTEVRVWSACNIAYTEKTITVTNIKPQKWSSPQEALYTFYMPEGSVVTALSLWINGKEEKGILTTKEKADSAYRTIVGVESRDPSVVHWQEGNTVSVRVFPVMPSDNRKFKIGISSPLKRVNGKLQYTNIYFEGPSYEDAKENILFDFVQPVYDEEMPAAFSAKSGQSYKKSGHYESYWRMQIKDPGLSDCSFTFDSKTYSLAPYHPRLSPFTFKSAYLDINASWTRAEYNQVIELLEGKSIYVYDTALVQLVPGNQEELWNRLHRKQFSLFPLYTIRDAGESVLISKSTANSPGLDELGNTMFMNKTRAYLQTAPKIKLFDLGDQLSPYLKSLKEFRVFLYESGSLDQLASLVKSQNFPSDIEDDNHVIIHQSDMVIQRKDSVETGSGPDHLYRLFTYNHIMQKLGTGNLLSRPPDLSLSDEAAKAYVVSPVSSLVVLETQADYDRFGISDGNKSLKNASMDSKGAVPEPHEWALIGISLFVFAFVVRRKRLQSASYDRTA